MLDVVKCTLLLHFNQVKRGGAPIRLSGGQTGEEGTSGVVKENKKESERSERVRIDRFRSNVSIVQSNQKKYERDFLLVYCFLPFGTSFLVPFHLSAYKGQHFKKTKKESLLFLTLFFFFFFLFFFCFKLLF